MVVIFVFYPVPHPIFMYTIVFLSKIPGLTRYNIVLFHKTLYTSKGNFEVVFYRFSPHFNPLTSVRRRYCSIRCIDEVTL